MVYDGGRVRGVLYVMCTVYMYMCIVLNFVLVCVCVSVCGSNVQSSLAHHFAGMLRLNGLREILQVRISVPSTTAHLSLHTSLHTSPSSPLSTPLPHLSLHTSPPSTLRCWKLAAA